MGKFVIKKTNTGFNFHLKAGNGETVATSEDYKELGTCYEGVQAVIRNAQLANVEDQTVAKYEEQKNPKFEIYKDKSNHFRFHLKATNGEIIVASEPYTTKANCKNGINSTKKNVVNAQIVEQFEE